MGVSLYTNQFGQQVAVGDLDLGVQQGGALVGIVSAAQTSPATLYAGQPVKIDTTITTGYVINFLQAAKNDLAIGFIRRVMNKASFVALDTIEVVGSFGPVIWLLADGTITPGQTVYNQTDADHVDGTNTGAKARGIALDYATTGQVLRVLVTNPLAIAS